MKFIWHSDILADVYFDILSNIFSSTLFGIPFYILFVICSGILFGILFDMLFGIVFGILFGIYVACCNIYNIFAFYMAAVSALIKRIWDSDIPLRMSKTLHPDLSVFLYDWCGFRSFFLFEWSPLSALAWTNQKFTPWVWLWVIPHPLRGEKDGGNAGCVSGAPFWPWFGNLEWWCKDIWWIRVNTYSANP